jgi:SAM-dependent methyltransferase
MTMDAAYWDAKYDTDEFIYTKIENRFVKEFCADLTPGKAIDLAGGEGRNTVWLASLGWKVENIDISAKALAKSAKFAAESGVADRCTETLATVDGFASQTAPVDLAVVGYLQIEMAALAESIAAVAKCLRPGGILVGVWHARENLDGGFGGPQNPLILPTAAELITMAQTAGLEVDVCENRDGQIQTKDGLKPSITVVLKAHRVIAATA